MNAVHRLSLVLMRGHKSKRKYLAVDEQPCCQLLISGRRAFARQTGYPEPKCNSPQARRFEHSDSTHLCSADPPPKAESRSSRHGRAGRMSAVRAFTSSACALSKSSVMRYPTRYSSRTPSSAISAEFTCAYATLNLKPRGGEHPNDWITAARTASRVTSDSSGADRAFP